MKQKIYINDDFAIDLDTLVASKLLVQANSGGGKSWLLRRILEQSHGMIQQIVIDLEGEFYTLRDKFDDYLLIGKGGDITASIRAAELLATSLLELGTSAIIDLSELKFPERKHFVRLFLESMIDAPEELNHPCLVVIDEAHHFAPEKGESEAAGAVIDLCTRGRKRQYCAILATQRISKLAKDAVAEINNKLIGRTSLDIDMKRASDELGFTTKEQYMSLRTLKPGEFFAFGTALTSDITKVQVGGIQTRHERAIGAGGRKPAPPSAAIRSMLAQLADLPQEAEKKARSEGELRKDLADTRRELTITKQKLENRPEATKVERIEVPAVGKRALEGIKKSEVAMRRMLKGIKESVDAIPVIEKGLDNLTREIALVNTIKPVGTPIVPKVEHHEPLRYDPVLGRLPAGRTTATEVMIQETNEREGVALKEGARKMLHMMRVRHPDQLTRGQLAVLVGFKARGGTFNTYISNLQSAGLIVKSPYTGTLMLTEDGLAYALNEEVPESAEARAAMWRGRLKEGARRMFDKIVEVYPSWITKEELGLSCGMVHTGGTFNTYISNMRSAGIITTQGAALRASDDVML